MERGGEEDQDRQESLRDHVGQFVQSLSSSLNCIDCNLDHNLLAAWNVISAAHSNAPAWPLWLLRYNDRGRIRVRE